MKTLPVFLVLLMLHVCCQAQTNPPAIRLVGTNLFDFSKAGKLFHVRGKVTKIYPQSTEISVVAGTEYRMVDSLPYSGSLATTADQADILEAINISHYSDGTERHLSVAQYVLLPNRFRIYFEPVPAYRKVYLLHPPESKLGQTISVVFVPTKTPNFYDCGVPFTGDTNSFHSIYRLESDSIKKEVY